MIIKRKDTITGLRQKRTISRSARHKIESFEKATLHFHQVKTFDEWWQAACLATDIMDFVRGSLPLTNRDGTKRILVWERKGDNGETDGTVKMTLPVRDRRYSARLNLEAHIYTNGSLESASHRATLFSRLLDEHNRLEPPMKSLHLPSVLKSENSYPLPQSVR